MRLLLQTVEEAQLILDLKTHINIQYIYQLMLMEAV